MEKLISKFGGEPPWCLRHLTTELFSDAASLMSDVKLGKMVSNTAVNDMFEILEVVGLIITVAEYPHTLFRCIEFDKNGFQWGGYGKGISHDTYLTFLSLLENMRQLKCCLCEYPKMPVLIKHRANCATICRHCSMVLERIDWGLNMQQPRDPKYIRTENINTYYLTSDILPDFPALRGRSQLGCEFCGFLREVLYTTGEFEKSTQMIDRHTQSSGVQIEDSNSFHVSPEIHVHIWLQYVWDVTGKFLRSVNIKLWSPNKIESRNRWDFVVESTDVELISKFGIFGPPKEDSAGLQNLEVFKRMIETAVSESNVAVQVNSYFPKRLVDLGSSHESCPKLILSHNAKSDNGIRQPKLDARSKYAVLSYCWGSESDAKMQLKLLKTLENKFLVEIPIPEMSPIMRDTVTTCRALGIRYVWIDALCIVQDDKRDWEEQSYQMSQIFENAWICICTPVSSSCMQGFLGKHIDKRFEITLGYKEPMSKFEFKTRTYNLRYVPELNPHKGCPAEDLKPNLTHRSSPLLRDLMVSHWNGRAWIFQEKLLSKRKLFFGAMMVHLEHNNSVTSEGGMIFHTDIFHSVLERDSVNISYESRGQMGTLTREIVASYGRNASDLWYRLTQEYSRYARTNELDIFPALAGIARLFFNFSNDQYLAGIWEKDIHCGLIWHNFAKEHKNLREMIPYLASKILKVAPSWSWASRPQSFEFGITNQINFLCRVRSHLRLEFSLSDVSISIDGENPFGRIRHGALKVSGRSLNLQNSLISPQRQGWYYEIQEGYCVSILTDWFKTNRNDGSLQDINISGEEVAKSKLLLVSSCCSESPDHVGFMNNASKSKSGQEREVIAPKNITAAQVSDNNQKSIYRYYRCDRHQTRSRAHGPHYGYESDGLPRVCKPEYRDSFLEDSDPSFDASTDCSYCMDKDRPRDVWGLLIYAAEQPNTYYRVGMFLSRAEHGGSRIFDNVATEEVTLI